MNIDDIKQKLATPQLTPCGDGMIRPALPQEILTKDEYILFLKDALHTACGDIAVLTRALHDEYAKKMEGK